MCVCVCLCAGFLRVEVARECSQPHAAEHKHREASVLKKLCVRVYACVCMRACMCLCVCVCVCVGMWLFPPRRSL